MASDNIKKYVWEAQIVPQLGYSFSTLHSTAYSLIALQEMNLAHNFPRIFWDTACLSVKAGADEDNDSNKSTSYGKVAAAIGKMKEQGIRVSLPLINKAGFGFTPDEENNQIIFGLKGIQGIGDEAAHEIIRSRPYTSFNDFYMRMYMNGNLQKKHMLQLIKAGAFNEFGDRTDIMKQFLFCEMDVKKELNMQNFPRAVALGIFPEEFSLELEFYHFYDYIKKFVHQKIEKPKDVIYKMDQKAQDFFNQHFTDKSVTETDGKFTYISQKVFKKEYDKKMLPIKEWLQLNEGVKAFNKGVFLESWKKDAAGTIPQWEMDSVSYYNDKHELDDVQFEKYGLSKLKDVPAEPVIASESKWGEKTIKKYRLHSIIGTVLDKDKNKHTITLLTTDGVVTVKFYGGQFSSYDKQISEKDESGKKTVLEKGWFARGRKVIVTGYFQGDQFRAKVYKNSMFPHTVVLVTAVRKDGTISIQTERTRT